MRFRFHLYRRVLIGMAVAIAVPAALSRTPAAASASLDAHLLYDLLLGEMTAREGNPQNGSAYVLEAARRTGDEALYKRAAEMAILSRSGPAALEATHAWRQAHPHSAQAARFQLQVLIALNRMTESEAPLRELLTALPPDERVPFIIALPALYQRVPDPVQATRTVEAALATAIKTPALAPAAWTSIGRLRLRSGDKSGALSAATLGQAAGASSEWPALLALQLLTDAEEPSAEALVRRYLDNADAKPDVRIAYIRALAEHGRSADAHQQLDTLTRMQPSYPNGWLLKGALLADERRDDEAEQALRQFLQVTDAPQAKQPSVERKGARDQARMMLARIAEQRGDLAAAEQLLAQVASPDQIVVAQSRRAEILARQGKLDEARQAIRSTPEREPDDARNKLLAEARLLREHQQPAAAYQMLTDALGQDPDDEALLYDAAITAERAGHEPDMERLLRRLIEIDPKAANAYNALGYSLADRGLQLPEAKRLIVKAAELAPDDYFIQDSLGWVEFRLGHMQEARRILEIAFQKNRDAEIAAHLGEVLWVLGEHDAARSIWRDGQRLNPDSETLHNTLKRLQVTL
jgi:tetratricopeptide (TPR) repeat protein